jgi:ABC-type antimicrobial peptide transport system permease subunit
MTRIDLIRGLVAGIAGTLVSGFFCCAALVLSMGLFEWIEQMPTDNIWFWLYGVVSVVLSVSLGVLTAWLSYRGLRKIGRIVL